MKTFVNLFFPAAVSFLLVAPLAVLEGVNTGGFTLYGFPTALFGALWLLGFVFLLLFMPVVNRFRSGMSITEHPVNFGVKAVAMILIAIVWVGLVNDQMPCFMGVPNCD